MLCVVVVDLQHGVAVAPPGPAGPGQGGHPLGLPLAPHLALQPHRHLPAPRGVFGGGGDEGYPCQQVHGLCPAGMVGLVILANGLGWAGLASFWENRAGSGWAGPGWRPVTKNRADMFSLVFS